MKPWVTVDRAAAPGGELVLARRGDEWAIRAGGHVLMTSRRHGSEEALAEVGCARLGSAKAPRVLVGGLGCGYTLRAVLDRLPPSAKVIVAELSGAVVAWNRGPLAALAGAPLDDPRVEVRVEDVRQTIAGARGLAAILLDVDNGPAPLAAPSNASLYGGRGLAAARAALARGGTYALWSAGPDERFLRRLGDAGFAAEAVPVKARAGAGGRHVLFVGQAR